MHQPATTRLAAWASAVALALGVVSCSSDDAGDPLSTLTDPPTTAPPVTTATTSTTVVTTTEAADTTTAAPPTTPPAPAAETVVTLGSSIPAAPSELEAAMYATFEGEQELFYEPEAPDLEARIGEVAEVGSQYESSVRQTLSQLHADGARFSPSEQPNNRVLTESITYDGEAEATFRICQISNDRMVSASDPTVVVDDYWDGRLHVARATIVMRRSGDGAWRRAVLVDVEEFDGVETCPPES